MYLHFLNVAATFRIWSSGKWTRISNTSSHFLPLTICSVSEELPLLLLNHIAHYRPHLRCCKYFASHQKICYFASFRLNIGVAGKFLDVRKIFAEISPNLHEEHYRKRTSKTTFWYEFGRHLVTPLLVFQGSCKGFQKFCQDFHRFSPNFKEFCSNFWQIKTFWGAFALPPPTSSYSWRCLMT